MLENLMGPNAIWLAESLSQVMSLDAYHYFGTDDFYLRYFARFVRAGGLIGIVVPGLRREPAGGLPRHLLPYWQEEFWTFHSPRWWQTHWGRTVPVRVDVADIMPGGWDHWLRWLEVAAQYGYPSDPQEAEMLRVDAGRNLGFARVVAYKLRPGG